MALRLAKRYNCKIVAPVTYTPKEIGGDIHFTVQCHSLTYHYFYEGGNIQTLHDSHVEEKDIAQYEKQFGTRKCIHKDFKRKYWFTSNWDGRMFEFHTLKAAKERAKCAIGHSVYIYRNNPYGRPNEIACVAEASGYVPP